jgi:hypothetical protein
VPPNTWTAFVVTSIATSEAKHFAALEMKPSLGSSRSALAAARLTSCLAASTFIATSASMNCTAWNSLMGFPNCLRCLTYRTDASSAPWAMPTACAPIVERVWSRVRSAVLRPVPGSPIIRSAGMAQSVK